MIDDDGYRVETRDRLRRIETRLTRFMEAQGFDTQARRPVWRDGEVAVPSIATSLRDVMAVVPDSWPEDKGILITHKGAPVMEVFIERPPITT